MAVEVFLQLCRIKTCPLFSRSAWPPVAHGSDLFSCWVGSNANHKIGGSKVMAEKHGANAMGIHGSHSVSWRETGASRFRPKQRSVNCCNFASFLHKTCKATSLPIIVCCVQRMQHAQRVSTFTADAQLLPRVFAPSLATRKPVN